MAALIGSSVVAPRRWLRSPRHLCAGELSPAHLRLVSQEGGSADPLTPVLLSDTERVFRFRGMPQAVGAARRALRQWESHFEPVLFYDLSLCVSELVTMSVQQRETGDDDEAELAVSRSHAVVRAEVREPRQDLVVRSAPVTTGNDWGMFIVDRVADRWAVERHTSTRVWCEIDLARDGRSRRNELAGGGRLPSSTRA
jgi:hypothetical protein